MEVEGLYRTDGEHISSPLVEGRRDHAYFSDLKRKLRWQLLGVYLTPLILLSGYFYFHYHRTLAQGIDNHLCSIAENQRNTVDLFLQERVANIRNLFRPEVLGTGSSKEKMAERLAFLRRESPTFVDLGLFHPNGTLVSYAGPYPSLVGKSYLNEEWFRRLSQSEKDYFISDVYLGFRSKPHFIVAVRQPFGGEVWTLRASVDPTKFGELVGGATLVSEAEAFIVNRAGQRQTLSVGEHDQQAVAVPGARSHETQISNIDLGDEPYLRAVSWLTQNDWALVVQVPLSKAYAPIRRARLLLLGVMPLLVGVIVWVVVRSTRRLVKRLEAATRAKETLRRQLFNAAKLASVGEIAAGVAHEINNPLAIIYEEAAMMRDILDPQFGQPVRLDEFDERLEAIKEAAIRGRSITRKLLAFAREHDPTPEPTDINRLVEQIIDSREANFKLSNIDICREFEADLPELMLAQNELDQVMLNLLNNAKDAIEDSGTITVRTFRREKWVVIEVEDTGAGMRPEVMENVFFPFFTTKEVGKGTGLGLSISYGIVKSMGGRIEVESEVGKGTVISLYIPAPVGRRASVGSPVEPVPETNRV
jgi:two-component system NtrC family sensor kinase